jgi:hypothetical protein
MCRRRTRPISPSTPLRAAPGTQPAPPGVRSSAHGPCRSPGQDAFGCVLAGIPGAYTNSSTPGRGNTHRRAPATSAQSRCLLPTISNRSRSHTAAWDRRSPPTAFVASTGARAGVAGPARGLQVWIDVLREGGAPRGGGLVLGAPPSPGRPGIRPVPGRDRRPLQHFAAGHPRRRDRDGPTVANIRPMTPALCGPVPHPEVPSGWWSPTPPTPASGCVGSPAGAGLPVRGPFSWAPSLPGWQNNESKPGGPPVGSRILTVISASSSAQSADHRGGPCPVLFRAAR